MFWRYTLAGYLILDIGLFFNSSLSLSVFFCLTSPLWKSQLSVIFAFAFLKKFFEVIVFSFFFGYFQDFLPILDFFLFFLIWRFWGLSSIFICTLMAFSSETIFWYLLKKCSPFFLCISHSHCTNNKNLSTCHLSTSVHMQFHVLIST